MSETPVRVLFLATNLSGYMSACWRELSARPQMTVRVAAFAATADEAPFAEGPLTRGIDVVRFDPASPTGVADAQRLVDDFKPDIVVVSGWVSKAYMALATSGYAGARYVMAMDTPYLGTWRQRLGKYRYAGYFKSLAGVVVTGERSYQFARVLGFAPGVIKRGVYGIDFDAQQRAHHQRRDQPTWPTGFLSVGRASEVKGIDTLLDAYARYRSSVSDPWPLTYCGTGPLSDQLERAEGVDYRGFVQPEDLAGIQAQCAVFVLASRFDPWPLVISESCAAGLPIICTINCGSAVELVREYYNGITVGPDDPAQMARAMTWMHRRHASLREMGEHSVEMARAYSSTVWADRYEAWMREFLG